MTRKSLSVVALIALLVVAMPFSAKAEPLKVNFYGLDGLFFATGGKTVPAGSLALGGGILFLNDDFGDAQSFPFTVTYGATDTVELAAAYEVLRQIDPDPGSSESGMGDLYLSAKLAVYEAGGGYPATALGLRLRLPTADSDVESSDETDIALFAASEMPMGSVTTLFNVEYVILGEENFLGDDSLVNYAVGFRIPYTETVDFSVELLDQQLVGDMLTGGATFDVGDHVNFGVAVGIGLTENTAVDVAVDGKLTFTF